MHHNITVSTFKILNKITVSHVNIVTGGIFIYITIIKNHFRYRRLQNIRLL